MNVMNWSAIGSIHSPHKQAAGTPVQSSLASGAEDAIEGFTQHARWEIYQVRVLAEGRRWGTVPTPMC
jgi:hypothetical protein